MSVERWPAPAWGPFPPAGAWPDKVFCSPGHFLASRHRLASLPKTLRPACLWSHVNTRGERAKAGRLWPTGQSVVSASLTPTSVCSVRRSTKPWTALFQKFPQLETGLYFAFWCVWAAAHRSGGVLSPCLGYPVLRRQA